MHGLETFAPGGFLIALLVGLLTGMLGIGGGFLMTPALIVLLGTPGHTAVGTSMATILTISVGASPSCISFTARRRRRSSSSAFPFGLIYMVSEHLLASP